MSTFHRKSNFSQIQNSPHYPRGGGSRKLWTFSTICDISCLDGSPKDKHWSQKYVLGKPSKKNYLQGVHLNVLKVIYLWENLKIQNTSWKGCILFPETGRFWYLVFYKFHSHSVIIHLGCFWRWIFVKICKIHWKLMMQVSIILQTYPQQKLGSLWNSKLKHFC